MLKRLTILTAVILTIITFYPDRHAKYYEFVPLSDVYEELKPVENEKNQPNLKICSDSSYRTILGDGEELDAADVYEAFSFVPPMNGGEYIPSSCTPKFRTAIIVPYRDRQQQLDIFLRYMHGFLQRQLVHYRMFIVDQNNTKPFNRAMLLNVGARAAIDLSFPCLILHDVDLLPLNLNNLYACARRPRHMSSSIDTFRYKLPYLGIVGGVTSIQAEDFSRINGMSNLFEGWGAEDDDFFKRLQAYDLLPYRFAPEMSTYTMLVHRKQKANDNMHEFLQDSLRRQRTDGLNSLPSYVVKNEPLYTHVIV